MHVFDTMSFEFLMLNKDERLADDIRRHYHI